MLLSRKQRQVVECLSNCLAVACPGSGKTRVLVQKVEHILKVDAGARILITSFTKDSAAEIRNRIVSAVGKEAARKVASGTFHSIALDQLKRAGFQGTVIGDGEMRQYIERALAECKLFDFELEDAIAIIEMAKLTPDYEPADDNHGRIFTAYSNLTERNNVLDFADILSRSVRMMRSGEMPPKDCNYLMTDESQDLDEMQYAWCAEHIKDRPDRKGAKFTVVGDDDQSIYKFRRALGYTGMLRFQQDFGADIIKLDTNYRCRSEILDSAGRVIAHNTKRIEKELAAERGKGGNVEVWHCGKSDAEAKLLISKVTQSCEPAEASSEYAVVVPKGEWAVLARNNHNLNDLAMAMVAHGIPHIYNGKNLWNERPVCLVLGLLSSLVTGKKAGFDAALHYAGMDEEVLIRLHNDYGDDFSQLFYGGQTDFSKYGDGTAENLKKFSKMVPMWGKALSKDRVSNVIRGAFDWFIEHMDTSKDGKKNKGGYQRDYDRLEAAKKIMANQMTGDLPQRIKRVMGKRDKKDKDDGVFLGTLHSSKGLEFKNVWLLQMDEGVMPDTKEWTEDIHEEERRLFYVGMTRAKDNLYISYTKYPSSFIAETGIETQSIVPETAAQDEPILV